MRIASALLVVALGGTVFAQGTGEFSAHGANVVRVENEAKLKVPREITEDVWTWLRARYADSSFLNRDGHAFTSTFGDEQFIDRYFDTPDLKMLGWKSGVRHRSRIVMEGSAMRKDGRQLIQLKLNRLDATGLERSEIKYTVDPPAGVEPENEKSLLALVDNSDRVALAGRLVEAGVNPSDLRPMLTINQNRRRVYVADQQGALATITLDMVSADAWWQAVRFTEIELELNEIRYTEADDKTREWMNVMNRAIQADLTAKFPAIVQDQTPKYNKAFAAVEEGMPLGLPLRRMIGWQLTSTDVLGSGLLVIGGLGLLVTMRVAGKRKREPRPAAPSLPAAVPDQQ
jgi:hypothetical protein